MIIKDFTTVLVEARFLGEQKDYASIEELLSDFGSKLDNAFTTENVGDKLFVSVSDDGERALIIIHTPNNFLHFEDVCLRPYYGGISHEEHIPSELEECSVNLFSEEMGGRVKFKHNGKMYKYFWEED
jgi:hypothetical protein